jgi:uncharacterized membrane protein YfcA
VSASPIELVVLIVAALGAGIVDAIAGGGGLITVPMLAAVGLPPHVVLATNKGQSVFGSAASLFTFWRAGKVSRRLAPYMFPLALAGSFAGAIAVSALAPTVLRPVVIVMLLCAAGLMLVRKPKRDDDVPTARAFGWAVALAVAIGFYDGFFGPGTGTFLIIGFVVLCGASLARATADAKVVNFASNLAAVIWFSAHGLIWWELALPMAGAQLAGGMIGARLALRGGAQLIRVVVVVVSLGLVAKLGYDLWAGGG